MKPKSFSATAFGIADLCMARYKAEYMDRGTKLAHPAASLGLAVHSALEHYVKMVYIDKVEQPTLKFLLELFKISYMTTFGTVETDTEAYLDGVDMLTRWHKRTSFEGIQVLSCEIKENFPIKTSIGDIPFNYIWDRADQIGDDEYRIVDYKSQRWAWRPDELRKKIQVRAYGLAAQIRWPNAKRIWVELDFLRHEFPAGVVITRDENIAAWTYFKARAQQIIDTNEDEVQETLNAECRFCVRKQSCSAVRSNIAIGGIMSLGTAKEMIDHRARLEYQRQAVEAALNEVDTFIIAEAKETDILEWESEFNQMGITASSRRQIDAERAEKVLGPELFAKYGTQKFSVTIADKLLKGDELTDTQKSQLRQLIYKSPGEARVTVKPKSPFGD